MRSPAEMTDVDTSPTFTGRLVTPSGEVKSVWHLPDEAPVNILYNGNSFAVMMATPHDIGDFAVGFSITEGIADRLSDIGDIRIAEIADGHVVNIKVDAAKLERAEGRRRTLTGRSGCGLCGAQSLDAVMKPLRNVNPVMPDAAFVLAALNGLKVRQPMNAVNKSTHAAAFCALDGTIGLVREDIGRHNALDKLAGALARRGVDAGTGFLVLSSRFSVEMAQKSAAIGAGFVASVSAPSALALRLARKAGLTVATQAQGGLMIFDRTGTAG
jgi:FdhD protein